MVDWTQIIALGGLNVGIFAAIATLVIWAINKLDYDMKSIITRMDGLSTRMDGHAARIDQLYSMFIELVKKK